MQKGSHQKYKSLIFTVFLRVDLHSLLFKAFSGKTIIYIHDFYTKCVFILVHEILLNI
jgi:hypothetical protein